MSDRNLKEQNEKNHMPVIDKNNYTSRREAMDLLGCSKTRFYDLYKKVFTNLVYEGGQAYLLRKEVEELKSASEDFNKRYCPMREAMLRLGLDVKRSDSYARLSEHVEVINCSDAMKLLVPKNSSKFCLIEDVERHLRTIQRIDTTRYITINEAISLLGCSKAVFMTYYKKIFSSCILSTKATADGLGKMYLLREEVESVKIAYEKLKEKYWTTDETAKYLNYDMTKKDSNNISYVKRFLQVIDCPEYAKLFIERNQGLCLIEDVKRYYQSRNKRRLDVIPDNPVLHIKKAIDTYAVKPYQEDTKELFKKYLVQKFTKSQASKQTKEASISKHLGILQDTLLSCKIEKPIYLFTTDEVNLLLSMEKRSYSYSIECYLFLEFCSTNRTCRFDIRRVEKPIKERINKTAGDIYDEDQFFMIYDYGTNVNLHISKAINSHQYASTWLYILMHFSNAWRHADVIHFPPIYPEALKIFDLSWFEKNRLKIAEGQLIINQVKNYKLEISKTGLRRHFFCNTDLIRPISTAMVICELHRRNYIDEPYLMQSKYMGKRARIRKRYFDEFFSRESELQSMGFSSLKANRSLMTHLFYSIQENEGKEGSAFELIQKMRNHLSDITKTYIYSNEGETGKISKALLATGRFGYIWDALLDVIKGDVAQESKPLIDRTAEIVELKRLFEEATDVEQFFNFLQTVENDRVSIVTQIHQLEPEEAFEHIRKIYLGENPSMVEDINCFVHPNCPTPSCGTDEEKGSLCMQCRYKIPNIYALTAIFNYLELNMNNYHHAITTGSKAKYYRNIAKTINVLNEAINSFGGEFVWNFYEGGEDALSEKLELIGEVKND